MESRKGFKCVMVIDFILLLAALAGNIAQYFFMKEVKGFFSLEEKFFSLLFNIVIEIQFGCACILAAAKNLGKTKSYILTSLIIIGTILMVLFYPLKNFIFLIPPLTDLILALVMGVMIYAKYRDKAERESK